ncbi:hypothetical protein PC110_g8435 [Phytophthora cactorum]|uniref:SWIM-type domain-containing protein n=2 Tax=Phytophthora cactorum TaxID=29920 RepID=A0A329SEN2_9STRA|nr:hypothetical protein PC110_g8435 [Phytophthora cactorum]
MWVTYYRMKVPHFGNNTNNRLEKFFGKLKSDLDRTVSMKQWLQAVVRYQRRKGDEYISRVVMPGTTRNLTYYEDMNQLLGMATEWMAGVFLTEYTFATETGMDRYTVEEEELYVTFRRDSRTHRVDKLTWLCTCEYSTTMTIPCRYVILYQNNIGNLMAFPFASIPAR